MAVDREHVVIAVVGAAGGRLTSRIRLQKSVYLLDQLGLKSGFDFEYYHFGPYSKDLDNATADATAFKMLEEDFGSRKSDGASYSIFILNSDIDDEAYGELNREKAAKLMNIFVHTNVTVLELAATAIWLWRNEGRRDWLPELKKRKALKARPDRLEKAFELIKTLGLDLPDSALAR